VAIRATDLDFDKFRGVAVTVYLVWQFGEDVFDDLSGRSVAVTVYKFAWQFGMNTIAILITRRGRCSNRLFGVAIRDSGRSRLGAIQPVAVIVYLVWQFG
jgi:hypothetical protein